MNNIIRVKLPTGTKRFKPFTVRDYRDFILMSTEMTAHPEEAQQILDEILEELYPDVEPVFREFVFLNVFTSSIGKTKIPLVFTCPDCKKEKQILLDLEMGALDKIALETSGLKISFKYIKPSSDYAKTFLDAIDAVSDGENEFKWGELDEDTRDSIIDAISFAEFEDVVKRMHTIHIKRKFRCCNEHTLEYTGLLPIFTLILNPDELFTFYRINHLLAKSNYSISDIMNMLPVERNVALTLIEKDVKEASKHAKGGIS